MLLSSLLPLLGTLPLIVRGRQVPIVGGVIGGVPASDTFSPDQAPGPVAPVVAGQLRVTENSGICGKSVNCVEGLVIVTCRTETTPGVYQASGYGDIASSKSIW